jgi:hypothetical protein
MTMTKIIDFAFFIFDSMKFFVSLIVTAIAAVSASTYNETVSSSCGSNCPGT